MDKHAYEASVMMVLEKKAAENVPQTEGVGMTETPLSFTQQGLNNLRQMTGNIRNATSNLLHRLGGNANPPSGTIFTEIMPQPPRNWLQRSIQPIAYAFDEYSGRDRYLHQMRAAEAAALKRTQEEAFKRNIRELEQESEKMRNDAWSKLLPRYLAK